MTFFGSLRTRIVLLILVTGVVPVGIVGYWLTGSATRTGEGIVRERLAATLNQTMSDLANGWISIRSELLTIAESPEVQNLLSYGSGDQIRSVRHGAVPRMAVLGRYGEERFAWSDDNGRLRPLLTERLPVYADRSAEQIGFLEVNIDVARLLAALPSNASSLGIVLAAIDPRTGSSFLPLPFVSDLLKSDEFRWGGDDWISMRHQVTEPAVVLIAAAPISTMTEPFEDAARKGLRWLLGIVVASVTIAILLTDRLTASLTKLSSAAAAVSGGDLGRRVEITGGDEVGRVAQAFNEMTDNLQRVMRELADRQSLAAVGEFAASLSHEIRNALTAIRLDLQVAGESLEQDSPARQLNERALAETARLNDTVTGALDLARRGRIRREPFNLSETVAAAIRSARPEFERKGVLLRASLESQTTILGDRTGIEQLLLNLLLNAVQSTPEGGLVTVEIEIDDVQAHIRVCDTGTGIPERILDRVFEPFYSTRDTGTGLGLPIARRIAQAHGGRLRIEASGPEGTTVIIELPRPSAVTK